MGHDLRSSGLANQAASVQWKEVVAKWGFQGTGIALAIDVQLQLGGIQLMNSNWNIVAIAVLAALIGGVGGASLMNSRTAQAEANPSASSLSTAPAPPALTNEQIDQVARIAALTAVETVRETSAVPTASVARASSARSGRAPRRVYYDYAAQSGGQPGVAYAAPQKRSFWSRHRDILTVGIGTALGTAIGAGTGGKKGALIGAGVGAGGSALYTYGLRDRSNRYDR
jgi:hypothetical protein